MSNYPYFQEIINEMKARPEADPVGILEENISPLLDACNKLNLWIAEHRALPGPTAPGVPLGDGPTLPPGDPTWDFSYPQGGLPGACEPPWYEEFITELARFDVDLTPIWRGSDWANGWKPAEEEAGG